MRRRFFVEGFDSKSATMRGETAEHLGRVLRAEAGQFYELSDGHRVWLGRIERVAISKRGESRIDFALIETIPAPEPSFRVRLLVSIVKFDRFEWCLEKATELGVTEIVPLAAARSGKPLLARAGKRQTRWEKIIVESAQQARRLRPPRLHPALSPLEAFAQSSGDCKVLLSERSDSRPLREALSSAPRKAAAVLAVGPEGGWTDAEINAARAAGFLEASLGENILRAETAVLASLAILGFAFGE
jgi:16S rRNA (uracil1498-N3)-methyltransferase